MSNKTRIWAGLFILILLIGACKRDDSSPTPTPGLAGNNQQPSTPMQPTSTPVPEPTAEEEKPELQSGNADDPQADPEQSDLAGDDGRDKALDGPFPLAPTVNDEGGPVSVSGIVTYTSPFFTMGVAEPVVILEDQAGFVDRNQAFIMPLASQTLGQITSNFFESPFSYTIALPIEPQGTRRDVDNDDQKDDGVQIFAIAYWSNTFGDPFLEERDLYGGGWSTAYASTLVSDDADTEREIIGGKFLIYAADDRQGFPAGFGEDGLLFTADDPIVLAPHGYTIVDLDSEPFAFDRSRNPVVDLIEPESTALVDYSDLGYAAAFDALVEQLTREYAFTDYKSLNWSKLHEDFRPLFESAESSGDSQAYRRALRDFSWAIPDGHVSGPFLAQDFREDTAGGLGLAIRELDDGRIVVNFVTQGGPAEDAGIVQGSQILTLNGEEIDEAVSNALTYAAPYSTEHVERLQKLRYVTRYPLGTTVDITWINPGQDQVQNSILEVVPESASFQFSSLASGLTGFEQPVEYEYLPEHDLGYVKIFSFADNELLTIQLWERFLGNLNGSRVPGLIIDLRQNGGGSGFLADQMAAYFFDEPLNLGNTGRYDKDRDDFYFDPLTEQRYYLPAEELRYRGDLAVIVGPNCSSACEFFAYDLTLQDRADIVGQYPTGGLGGGIERVLMPGGENFTFTQGRAVDAQGNIHIEGIGVKPTVVVPVNEATVSGLDDPMFEAAIAHLKRTYDGELVEAGSIALGDQLNGTLQPGTRDRYVLTLSQGDIFSLYLGSDDFQPVLGLYDDMGNELGSTAGAAEAVVENLEVPYDLILILEVAAADDGGGIYTLLVENIAQ